MPRRTRPTGTRLVPLGPTTRAALISPANTPFRRKVAMPRLTLAALKVCTLDGAVDGNASSATNARQVVMSPARQAVLPRGRGLMRDPASVAREVLPMTTPSQAYGVS